MGARIRLMLFAAPATMLLTRLYACTRKSAPAWTGCTTYRKNAPAACDSTRLTPSLNCPYRRMPAARTCPACVTNAFRTASSSAPNTPASPLMIRPTPCTFRPTLAANAPTYPPAATNTARAPCPNAWMSFTTPARMVPMPVPASLNTSGRLATNFPRATRARRAMPAPRVAASAMPCRLRVMPPCPTPNADSSEPIAAMMPWNTPFTTFRRMPSATVAAVWMTVQTSQRTFRTGYSTASHTARIPPNTVVTMLPRPVRAVRAESASCPNAPFPSCERVIMPLNASTAWVAPRTMAARAARNGVPIWILTCSNAAPNCFPAPWRDSRRSRATRAASPCFFIASVFASMAFGPSRRRICAARRAS